MTMFSSQLMSAFNSGTQPISYHFAVLFLYLEISFLGIEVPPWTYTVQDLKKKLEL